MGFRMRRLLFVLLSFGLVLSSWHAGVQAQIETSAQVELQSSSLEGISFEVQVPWELISVELIEEQGQTYTTVNLPGWDTLRQPGAPQLPFLIETLGVPFGVDISIDVIPGDFHTIDLSYPVTPTLTQKLVTSLPVGIEDEPLFSFEYEQNPDIYDSGVPFPGVMAEVTNDGVVRNQRVAGISIYPIQYDPRQQSLVIYESLKISIEFEGAARLSGEKSLAESTFFEDSFKSMLLNYEDAKGWRSYLANVMDYSTEESGRLDVSGQIVGQWSPPENAYKISVLEDGFYTLTYNELQTAGLPVGTLDPRTFQIYSQGEEIAIKVDGEGDGVFNTDDAITFFGESIQNKYSAKNVYWLTYGNQVGKRVTMRDGTPSVGDTPMYYKSQSHLEENHYYRSVLPGEDDFERFYWDSLYATDSNPLSWTRQFQVVAPQTGVANLKAAIFGSIQVAANPDHHMIIRINGVDVADIVWDGLTWYQVNEDFDASILVPGENTLEVYLPNDTGVTVDLVLVDWIEISFPSDFTADPTSDELVFAYDLPGTWQFPITGFSTTDLMVYDVSDPINVVEFDPASLSIELDGPEYRLTFEDEIISQKDYWATSSATIKTIMAEDIVEHTPSSLQLTSNQVDYLIISHKAFLGEVQALADHRYNQGLDVMVVDVEDIYDEFGYGLVHPEAIRTFLGFTILEWTTAPSYVVLVGDGHYDPKNYMTSSPESYIPPYLAFTDPWDGETAADNRYVSLTEGDNLADMMLGRLAVNTPAEAAAFIDKIITYESIPTQEDWMMEVLAVAGEADNGGNFPLYSDNLINDTLPAPYTAEKISYGITHTTKEAAQAALKAEISEGKFIVNFIGHGFSRGWSASKNSAITFIQTSDIPALTNTGKYPIFLPMTCKEGAFHDPSTPSFGESITRVEGKGGVASWSPTGQGVSSGHDFMNRGFFEAIFKYGVDRLGEAVQQGQIKLWVTDSNRYLLDGYVLFGDPAMLVNRKGVAVDDDYYTTEDEILEATAEQGVLRNDFGLAFGNTLRAEVSTSTAHGTLNLYENGAFSYEPDLNWYGVDSFTYNLYDSTTFIGTATVMIEVFSVNDKPIANPQSVSTEEDTPVEIILSGSDVDGDPITYRIIEEPSHGSLSGTVPTLMYSPDAGFNGTDRFTFVVNDGEIDSTSATVTITVGDEFLLFFPLLIR
jgi:hypothetical protein